MPIDHPHNSKEMSVIGVVSRIAAIWIISDVGYSIFLPTLGFGGGFNANPIVITFYYLFWLALTIITFWDLYKDWHVIQNRKIAYLALALGSVLIVLYLTYILPHFHQTVWSTEWKPPSELLSATPWYFLPRSIEILLQQTLILAMVLSFSYHKFSLKTISVWSAILFGGAHLLLIFGSEGMFYAATFTVSAVVASFIFPYLILRVKNGFVYSYLLHWSFYALVIIFARLVFKI